MIIRNRIAVVVGGVRGMGRTCVDALLDKGAKVCFGDILEDDGFALLEQYHRKYGSDRALFARCDASRDSDIEALFDLARERFSGQPEIVLNLAGILDETNWEKCLNINIGGCVRTVNTARKFMGLNNGGVGGTVVLMSSKSGILPEDWGPVYAASKHAVIGLTRSWALEKNFKIHGIRFNCLCPDTVNTAFLEQVDKGYHASDSRQQIAQSPSISTTTIAEGFIRLVEDDQLNGKALKFTLDGRVEFHEFNDTL